MNKRKTKKLYKKYIDDIVWEISCNNDIRRSLAAMPYNTPIEISKKSHINYNGFLDEILSRNLVFRVEKTHTCPEKFDEGLVIFKFTTKYGDIVRYSGNNLFGKKLQHKQIFLISAL